MADFAGYVKLGDTIYLTIHAVETDGDPATPSGNVVYTAYSGNLTAAMSNGTGNMSAVTSAVTGWYKCGLDATAANGYQSGNSYFMSASYTTAAVEYWEDQTFIVT